MRQCLDVLHQGRAAAQALLRKTRRHERRDRLAAGQMADERGLLSRQESRRRRRQLDRDPVRYGALALPDRLLQSPAHVLPAVGGGAEDRSVRAYRLGCQLETVEHQVRGEPEEGGVLIAGRLGLGTVRDDDGGPAAPARRVEDRLELAVHGEGAAAAAGQARFCNVVDEDGRTISVGQAAVARQVRGQVLRACVSIRQQPGEASGGRPLRVPAVLGRAAGGRGGHGVVALLPVRASSLLALGA